MILYCYDESGAYTGPVSPALSPARPFVNGAPNYLRPARSTSLPPPQAGPGEAAVFDGSAWALVQDHRGRTAWCVNTREPREVTTLGPLEDGLTFLPPPSALHAWDGRAWTEDPALALGAMRAERDARLAASDWTQLPDAPLDEARKAAWAAHRQALRDHPQGWIAGEPWPQRPGE